MKALTLIRPWPWAMLLLPPEVRKRIENRKQSPPSSLVLSHRPFAMHAGLKWDDDAAALIERLSGVRVPPEAEHPKGVIVGVACIDRVVRDGELDPACRDRWFFGPVGIVVRDEASLRVPIPCRGMNGWWPVTRDIEALVREQLPC